MRALLLACLAALALSPARETLAAEWRLQIVEAPAHVNAIDKTADGVRVDAGGLWYRLSLDGENPRLAFVDKVTILPLPRGALPGSRAAAGTRDIERAWLTEPTPRYDHGILGDKIEAGALVIDPRDGTPQTIRLKPDAVFEDLHPRLADLDRDGHDEIVVVKSYLKRGSSLAVIAARKGRYAIVAETPPPGTPNRWLDPAGIADFNGDGKVDIALVRQPHVAGALELWTWDAGRLVKTAEIGDVSNHIAGSGAIDMSTTADFDGDGIADLAVPSFDRKRLRIIGFVPQPHEIASIPLPAQAATDFALIAAPSGPPMIALGLADGRIALARAQ